MKKKKTYLINKKRIVILICLTLLVIFEVVALQRSKAAKVIEVIANVEDNEKNIENSEIMLEATNSGASGYYLALPEFVNGKRIGQYYIVERDIHNKKSNKEVIKNDTLQESVNEETLATNEEILTSTNQEEIIENIEVEAPQEETEQNIAVMYPGEKLFLTDDEISDKKITLRVGYNTLAKNEKVLYEQKIEAQLDDDSDGQLDTKIIIEGFMPLDSTISATKVEIEQIQDSIEEMLSKKVSFKKAYDIKIIAGETEYEPTEFDTNVKVTISGLEKIDENNQIFRVLRKSFRTSDMVTYIEDILFGILTGIFLIIMLFIFNNGQLRFFIFVAIFLGLLLYLLTISKYFIKINVIILTFIKKLVHTILYPIQKLYKIMTKPFYFLIINFKKLHIRKSKKLSKK